jgi:Outer membrane protein beta-barrel domain
MRTCVALVMLLALPALAAAQDRTPPPASGLTLERIHNDFVVAPDFKITDVDGRTGNLVGVSAGLLTQDTFFVGGAGYWLANGSENDFEMMYGGLTLGWNFRPEHRVQFGARSLFGFGRATLGTDVNAFRFDGRDTRGRLNTRVAATQRTSRFGVEEDFLVAEPEVTFGARLTDHLGLNIGAGYRFAGLVDRLDDRLNGASGTISLQLRLP